MEDSWTTVAHEREELDMKTKLPALPLISQVSCHIRGSCRKRIKANAVIVTFETLDELILRVENHAPSYTVKRKWPMNLYFTISPRMLENVRRAVNTKC